MARSSDIKVTDTRARKRRAEGVKFTASIADEICYRLASGESLKSICRMPGMPTFQSVLRWVNEKPEFAKCYVIACDMRTQYLADEILDIADTPAPGTRTKTLPDGGEETTTLDQVERSRLRVDSRKWLLARLAPKRFGDRLLNEISGPAGAPVEVQGQGPPRPSPKEISDFCADVVSGWQNFRDEQGQPVPVEHERILPVIAQFAAGGFLRTGVETGVFLASIACADQEYADTLTTNPSEE